METVTEKAMAMAAEGIKFRNKSQPVITTGFFFAFFVTKPAFPRHSIVA